MDNLQYMYEIVNENYVHVYEVLEEENFRLFRGRVGPEKIS